MKREVERKRRLPAFSIDTDDFELLWSQLRKLFDSEDRVYETFDVSLPKVRLEFKSIEELKSCTDMPAKVSSFTLYLHGGARTLHLRSGGMFSSPALISVRGETEAWCAGAVETAYAAIERRKAWYAYLRSAPSGIVYFGLVVVFILAAQFLAPHQKLSLWIVIPWSVGTVISLILWLGRDFMPAGVLVLRDKESFIARHGWELTLLVGLISAIAAIAGMFIKR